MAKWEDMLGQYELALLIIAGRPDPVTGFTYASTLHDVGKIAEFAERVLNGEHPHDILDVRGKKLKE